MSSTTRGPFSSKLEDNYNFISRVVGYLNNGGLSGHLGVTANNMAILNHLWTNPTPTPPATAPNDLGLLELWALHLNPATKGPGITRLLHARLRQEEATDPIGIENQIRVIFADIPTSALTASDRTTLNIPLRKTTRTIHQVATKNSVVCNLTPLGGGDVLEKCFPSGTAVLNPSASTERNSAKTTGRAHKEAGYNLRTLLTIIKQGAAVPTLTQAPDPNAMLPAGWSLTIETKARTVRHNGVANIGNVLVEFKQWYNSAHPDLDGPMSGPFTTIIT